MSRAARAFVAPVAALIVAALAFAVAGRFGGALEVAVPPARPAVAPVPIGDDLRWEVALRLTEHAASATFDVPDRATTAGILGRHWRKLAPPFLPSPSAAAPFVTQLSLTVHPALAPEPARAPVHASAKNGSPDARLWNMDEGSFQAREALVAAAPSSFGFAVSVPARARFSFAAASVNEAAEATVFTAEVTDEQGVTKPLCSFRLPPAEARRWHEQRCALDAYAGQEVTMRLVTASAPATPEERREAARVRARRERARRASPRSDVRAAGRADAGAPDALDVPGTAVALWGTPTIDVRTAPQVPMNVLWIVVDALRPDVLASFHDPDLDRRKQAAGDAWLPRVTGLTPAMDGLAERGVRFTQAYSAATWTRPGMLAMLAGARATELGIDPDSWVVPAGRGAAFYASDPPLLPLLLRRRGVSTRAVVNNSFMVGYTPIGVDMGFEQLSEHRYRTRAAEAITQEAVEAIERASDDRFFLMVNYDSPHEPYEPPREFQARVPAPPAGPTDPRAALYMAEAARDDRGIGRLLEALTRTGCAERTIVVLTADHGETLSSAHDGTVGPDRAPVRYHHATSNFEETTHVPLIIVAPGRLPAGAQVDARVRSTDVAPTLLELLGQEIPARMSGRSLVGLSRGRPEPERVLVSEGRGSRAIIVGDHRLVVMHGEARQIQHRDRPHTVRELLFDLKADPGERHDRADLEPERVSELRARLSAALANVTVAGSAEPASLPGSAFHLRFVGAGRPRRISGTVVLGDARDRASAVSVTPVEIGKESFTQDGARVALALVTHPSAPVGFDIVVDPPTTPIAWQLYLDDAPWPSSSVFGGPFGVAMPTIDHGVQSPVERGLVTALRVPPIDPARDLGLFVTRDPGNTDPAPAGTASTEAEGALVRLLRDWGYAHGSAGSR